MIHIESKEDCCGCGACVQKCPRHCISMVEDKEGFLYPHIDTNVCIECNICERVCPTINQNVGREPLNVLAAQNKNDIQRINSSSGGIFILLADYVLRKGGFVVGAVFDENWEVRHYITSDVNDVYKMMGSKYVQSKTEDTYERTKALLKNGSIVLYSGTPCQIAGLHRYLQKEYENLITVDFICHGVPSPFVWRDYLNEFNIKKSLLSVLGIDKEKHNHKKSSSISHIEFRNKTERGWRHFSFYVKGRTKVLLSDKHHDNLYMKAFLNNLILRPSCYDCPAKQLKSGSDITMADFWSIEKVLPQWSDDNNGTSLLLVNTEKGNYILEAINNYVRLDYVSYDSVKQYNTAIIKSAVPHKNREVFFRNYTEGKLSVNYLIINCCYDLESRIRLLVKLVLKYFHLYNK